MNRETNAGVRTNIKKPQKRAAEATNVSEKSVMRIVKEMQTVASGESISFATLHEDRLAFSPKSTLRHFNGCTVCQSLSQSYFTIGGLPPISSSWRQAP
jgi:hypothetical protein